MGGLITVHLVTTFMVFIILTLIQLLIADKFEV